MPQTLRILTAYTYSNPVSLLIPGWLSGNPCHRLITAFYMPNSIYGLSASSLSVLHMAPTKKFDCLGLAIEWESNAELRERIRAEKRILMYKPGAKFCEPNRANATQNSVMLLPMLGRLADTEKRALPHLDDLEIEVRTLYEKCGLNPGEKGPYQTSVELKRLVGLVKTKARRKEVTKEPVLKTHVC